MGGFVKIIVFVSTFITQTIPFIPIKNTLFCDKMPIFVQIINY